MQLPNINGVYKQNNMGIWIRIIYMKAVWGHARAELIEAEDTIIKWGKKTVDLKLLIDFDWLRWKTCEKLIFCYIVIFTIILALIVRHEHKIYFQKKKSQKWIMRINESVEKAWFGTKTVR